MVCFDESSVQLIGEVRQPIPAEPGRLERYDYEYRRNGTVNLFVLLDVHLPGARSKSTSGGPQKTTPNACATSSTSIIPTPRRSGSSRTIYRPILPSLYQAFPPAEARRILRRLEFHHTRKHASWLNMVEIEIGVLRGQCLDRRIDDPKRLRREITAWEQQRNAARSRIKWMFTTDKARAKMGRTYPRSSKES